MYIFFIMYYELAYENIKKNGKRKNHGVMVRYSVSDHFTITPQLSNMKI